MNQADTLVEQGMKLHSAGRAAESDALFRQALEMQPTHKMALYMLGNALNARGDFENGLALLQRAVALHPNFAEAHYSLGAAFIAQNQLEQAALALQCAVHAKPDFSEAWMALGNVCLRREDKETALDCFRQLVQLRPGDIQARFYLAGLAHLSGHYEEAAASYERCLAGNLRNAEIFTNLGNVYCQLERFESAEAMLRSALFLRPGQNTIHHNLGFALFNQGKLAEAKEHLRRASLLDPSELDTQHDYWNALLLNGDYEQGWEVYEGWMRLGNFKYRPFQQPCWDGSAHPDQTLLVYASHGLGDAIQFVRYLPLVKERFQGRVVLECQPQLCALFRTCQEIEEVVARNADNCPPDLPFDARIDLWSLGHLFHTTLETIPADIPYLNVPAERLEHWRARMPRDERLNVGIRWAGSVGHGNDKHRSLHLNDFAALARIPGLRLFSLQTDQAAEQTSTPPDGMEIIDLIPEAVAFLDHAAFVKSLDLVITVDTAVAHLAGALGVPTWTLLSFIPDWRWLLEREDTPWYSGMRLFRQPKRFDWQSVFERVANDLTPRPPSLHARTAR